MRASTSLGIALAGGRHIDFIRRVDFAMSSVGSSAKKTFRCVSRSNLSRFFSTLDQVLVGAGLNLYESPRTDLYLPLVKARFVGLEWYLSRRVSPYIRSAF